MPVTLHSRRPAQHQVIWTRRDPRWRPRPRSALRELPFAGTGSRGFAIDKIQVLHRRAALHGRVGGGAGGGRAAQDRRLKVEDRPRDLQTCVSRKGFHARRRRRRITRCPSGNRPRQARMRGGVPHALNLDRHDSATSVSALTAGDSYGREYSEGPSCATRLLHRADHDPRVRFGVAACLSRPR
jgi:hypothetical protein